MVLMRFHMTTDLESGDFSEAWRMGRGVPSLPTTGYTLGTIRPDERATHHRRYCNETGASGLAQDPAL